MCPLSGDRHLGVGAINRHEILDDGTNVSEICFLPFWSTAPRDPQIQNVGPKFWPFDCIYLKNSKSERYVPVRA